MTSSAPESTLAKSLDGNTNCDTNESTTNMTPAVIVAIMMARGTLRVGSLASSDSVDTASKPRNDRHRIAAPASTGFNPGALPSPLSGSIRSTVPLCDNVTTASTRNTTMNTACIAMINILARATETIPIVMRTNTHGGTAGIAALR